MRKPASRLALTAANDNESTPSLRRAKSNDVRRLFGDIEREYIVEILRTGPTLEELEEVYAWLVRRGDIMACQGATKARGIAAILEFVM